MLQEERMPGLLRHLYRCASGTQGAGQGGSRQAEGSSRGVARAREKPLELRLGTKSI